MSSQEKPIPEELKRLVRAVIISAPKGRVELGTFTSEFIKQVHVPFLFKRYGFASVFEILEFMSDTVVLKSSNFAKGGYYLTAIIVPGMVLPPSLAKRGARLRATIIQKSEQSRKLRNERENDSRSSKLHSDSASMDELYIGNLPPHFTEEDIRQFLCEYNCEGIRMITEGRKHFAFVEMDNKMDVNHAVRALNLKTAGGNTIIVDVPSKNKNNPCFNENDKRAAQCSKKGPPPLEPFVHGAKKHMKNLPPPLENIVPSRPPAGKTARSPKNRSMQSSHDTHSQNQFHSGPFTNIRHKKKSQNHQKLESSDSLSWNREEMARISDNRPFNMQFDYDQQQEFQSRDLVPFSGSHGYRFKSRNNSSDLHNVCKQDNFVVVCIANFPFYFSKLELKDLVCDFQPMKIVMGINKHLPPPNDITFAFVSFLTLSNAEYCVEVLDNFMIDDNVLYAYIDDEKTASDTEDTMGEYENHLHKMVNVMNLGDNASSSSSYELVSSFEDYDEEVDEDEYVRQLVSKLYPQRKTNDQLVSKLYPRGRQLKGS